WPARSGDPGTARAARRAAGPAGRARRGLRGPPVVDLFPEERALVALSTSDERRREFATVRMCARTAPARLWVAPVPVVPRGGVETRARHAPSWPDGIVGGMTRCRGYRAAAVLRDDVLASLGIDGEPHTPAAPPG
ncbi:hypothetical protein ABT298_30840, partial [Streptomyces sp. NPDC001034]